MSSPNASLHSNRTSSFTRRYRSSAYSSRKRLSCEKTCVRVTKSGMRPKFEESQSHLQDSAAPLSRVRSSGPAKPRKHRRACEVGR
eukprot:2396762-Pleurochrysis_carterae.AAC.1